MSQLDADKIHLTRLRGTCPSDQELVALHGRTLPSDRETEMHVHVRLCGTCQVALEMLERADQCEAAFDPGSAMPPEVERRVRERFLAYLRAPRASSFEQPSGWVVLKRFLPVFACLLILALIYPAYIGLFRSRPPTDGAGEEQAALRRPRVLPTFEIESPERGRAGGPSRVVLSQDQPFLALTFFVPVRETAGYEYHIQILDERGARVLEIPRASPPRGLGTFTIACSRDSLSPGNHTIMVNEVDRTSGKETRTFSFPFVAVEHADAGHGP